MGFEPHMEYVLQQSGTVCWQHIKLHKQMGLFLA